MYTHTCFCTGQFGKVFKAVLNKRGVEPIQVAVKTAKKSSSVKEKEEFEREMKIMSQMMHPNIVRFYGVVQEGEKQTALLTHTANHYYIITVILGRLGPIIIELYSFYFVCLTYGHFWTSLLWLVCQLYTISA